VPGPISSLARVKRTRIARALVGVIGVALAAMTAAAPASAAPLPDVVADDLAPARATKVVRAVRLPDGHGVRLGERGSVTRELPRRPWSLSIDVRPATRSTLVIESGPTKLVIDNDYAEEAFVRGPGIPRVALPAESFAGRGWRHIEIVDGADPALAIDGQVIANDLELGDTVRVRVADGSAQATALIATRRDDRRAALLHRLAELHARTPLGRFPVGIGADDGLLRFTRDWTDGFWPGMLWLAADLTGPTAPFADWARTATAGAKTTRSTTRASATCSRPRPRTTASAAPARSAGRSPASSSARARRGRRRCCTGWRPTTRPWARSRPPTPGGPAGAAPRPTRARRSSTA
jgi:hypothetical protein